MADSSLPDAETRARAARARRERVAESFGPLLVRDPDNVFWLTGTWGLRGKGWLLFDGRGWRYLGAAGGAPKLDDVELVAAGEADLVSGITGLLPGHPVRVDQEPGRALARVLDRAGWTIASREIEVARQCKDDVEVVIVARNVGVLNEALKAVSRLVEPGRSEIDLWRELGRRLRLAETEGVEITGNLGSGERSADEDPHAEDRRLRDGELVLLDAYPRLAGYYADLTRTWSCGTASPKVTRMHAAVTRALAAVGKAVGPGVVCGDLDRLAHGVLANEGYPSAYGHHTGHGFGVKQQESPWLRPGSTDVLRAGMVIAVEPACYLPGLGGVRLEQDFLVTDRGARPLGDTSFALAPEA